MVIIGGILGGLIFGLYLMVTYVFGKVNCDWIFSSQRIADYRCFLRMKFEPDKLTIYPIRVDSVPDRTGWRWRRILVQASRLVEPISRSSRVSSRDRSSSARTRSTTSRERDGKAEDRKPDSAGGRQRRRR